jgi:hypothetical protein
MKIPLRTVSICFFGWFLCLNSAAFAQEKSLPLTRASIRQAFWEAQNDSRKVQKLVSTLENAFRGKEKEFPPEIVAYYGALKALQAKYDGNPLQKLKYLSQSLSWLDEAVARGGQDLEVRFVRFASLHHLPVILGVGKRRGADSGTICRLLEQKDYSLVDKPTQKDMLVFMLNCRRLSLAQDASLQRLFKEWER